VGEGDMEKMDIIGVTVEQNMKIRKLESVMKEQEREIQFLKHNFVIVQDMMEVTIIAIRQLESKISELEKTVVVLTKEREAKYAHVTDNPDFLEIV
jgi:hypothetical protein